MIFYGLKEATKDCDVILENAKETNILVNALKNIGYYDLGDEEISNAYKKMEAYNLENSDGFRWDIFDRLVCNKLALSSEMKSRGTEFFKKSFLRVRLLSKEDIFLLKSVTEREADLVDMRLLVESGLNWQTIKQECHNQSTSSGILWENAVYERLVDLRNKYKIESPIEKPLRRHLEEKLNEITIMNLIKQGNDTFKKISRAAKEPESFIRISLRKMENKGLIEVDRSHRPFRHSLRVL